MLRLASVLACIALMGCADTHAPDTPFIIVLGVGQDGGVPQTGDWDHPGWVDPSERRMVSSIAVVDPESGMSLLFDATPDLPRQLRVLHESGARQLPEIFLTHAHIGHYTGLMWLGHESMGAQNVAVHGMPRMNQYLRDHGPWSQLVRYDNIVLNTLSTDSTISRGPFRVTPLLVPHRQEFSEVVGYRIEGPNRSVLFIPDIDSWEEWDDWGVSIEAEIARVDLAYLDATFYANGEIPGRDMSGFPHPFITHSMERFAALPTEVRSRIRFIHLNHTNPALWEGPERREIIRQGFGVANEGEIERL